MAAGIDSQSITTTESVGPRGFDAGKNVQGRKHHAMVETDGRVSVLQVRRLRSRTDPAYGAERAANPTRIVIESFRKLPDQVGFVALLRRWMVERYFAWIKRNRRLAKGFEGTVA